MGKFFKGLLAGGAAGMAALAAVNASIARGTGEPEESPLGGEMQAFPFSEGRVLYRVAGTETEVPVVLLHRIDVGASSFMWRRNFDPLARDFRIYAPDLLGFGLSDKPANAPYSADLYVRLIAEFLRDMVRRPAHLIASSLSAAFAVRVADEESALVRSLMLVAPISVATPNARPDLPGAAFYGLLHSPVLGASFYNAMTSERGLRDYARKQLFYDPRFVTNRLVAQYYALSHQPGAQCPIAASLSGYLNADTRDAFARLAQDITLVWGRQDQTNTLVQADALLRLNPRARLEVFDPCRMMPQEEHAARFNELVRERVAARSIAAA